MEFGRTGGRASPDEHTLAAGTGAPSVSSVLRMSLSQRDWKTVKYLVHTTIQRNKRLQNII